MTSPSRKRRPTTRWSTSPASRTESEAARAYRVVDAATRPRSGDPLWLPSGWLAVVVLLTVAAQAWGAPSNDGWRPRRATKSASLFANPMRQKSDRPVAIQQVGFEDDIAGPALRGAQPPQSRANGYRVAQRETSAGNSLIESFGRPFGVEPQSEAQSDANAADGLFDDLPTPTDPDATAPQPPGLDPAAQQADSLFDEEEPAPAAPTEPADELFNDDPAPSRFFDDESDLADDLSTPFGFGAERTDDQRREEASRECAENLAELKASRLSDIDLSIAVSGVEGEEFPYACTLDDGTVFTPRMWSEVTYMWKASGLCHKPLYFEDVHLERYGHSWGPYVQPLVSGAHFFGRLPILPYMMGLKMPNECVYTLGHYRPGDCAPYLIDPVPFTWRAALMQGAGTMGVVGILP